MSVYMRQIRFVNKAKARPYKNAKKATALLMLQVYSYYSQMWKIETYSCGNFKYTGCSIVTTIMKRNAVQLHKS